ncbi:MAG: methyltransferase domain-containing protein [Novosphingobium sp.]|nr:methyltransferase domain-containing protein [Novosphingobium sp.]MCP5379334.1 methyltransferase domain-containing protein [Novosphingobium sp.]
MTMINGNSFDTFDELCSEILKLIRPRQVLEIGAGKGKYGRLIRTAGLAETSLIAVEPDAAMNPLLTENGYSEIVNRGADCLYETPDMIFDFIIMGDVLEHFRYSEGLDLLQYLNYRAAYILIITPEAMPLRAPEFMVGHNAQWPPRLMTWHDYWLYQRCGQMHFYLLRGNMDDGQTPLAVVMEQINAAGMSLRFPTNAELTNYQTIPVQLQLVDQRTHDVSDDATVAWYYRPA